MSHIVMKAAHPYSLRIDVTKGKNRQSLNYAQFDTEFFKNRYGMANMIYDSIYLNQKMKRP